MGEIVILGDTARGRECYTARQGQGTLPRVRKVGGRYEMGILLADHGWRPHPELGTVPGVQDWMDIVILGDIARISERRGHCQGFREGGTH